MNDYIGMLAISSVLQIIAWFSLAKGMRNEEAFRNSKLIKIGMNALIWGIVIQFLVLVVWLYSAYVVSGIV